MLNDSEKTNVEIAASDDIFCVLDSMPQNVKNRLPVYDGELISTDHGAGGYTSRTASKRLNRRCEQLLEASELMSATALYKECSETLFEPYDKLTKRECTFKVTEKLEKRHEKTDKEKRIGNFRFKKGYALRQLAREKDMRF